MAVESKKQENNKITPTLRRALIQASTAGRVAVLKPIFEGEDCKNVEVLEVLNANTQKKFGYDLHHVEGLAWNCRTGKFAWEYCVGSYHRGRYGGYYFEVDGVIKKTGTCVPVKKTDTVGEIDDLYGV